MNRWHIAFVVVAIGPILACLSVALYREWPRFVTIPLAAWLHGLVLVTVLFSAGCAWAALIRWLLKKGDQFDHR
jgi:hypothetical protein